MQLPRSSQKRQTGAARESQLTVEQQLYENADYRAAPPGAAWLAGAAEPAPPAVCAIRSPMDRSSSSILPPISSMRPMMVSDIALKRWFCNDTQTSDS